MPSDSTSQFSLLRRARSSVLDLAFPPRCVACDASTADQESPDRGFCSACRNELHGLKEPLCRRCALPLVFSHDGKRVGPKPDCPQCAQELWAFDRIIALGAYEGLLRHLILSAKRSSGETAARALGALLASVRMDHLSEYDLCSTVVAPIPSHWIRRITRQVNSPDSLAEQLASAMGIKMLKGLRRVQHTKRQTEVPHSQRIANVRDAFRVTAKTNLVNKTVLLVDDVLTTGATASSAARELKRVGAKQVVAVVAARRLGRN